MHGQHAVHHDHGRTRDGDLIGQAFDLPVELVKREPSAEVQSGKARLDIGPEGLKHGNEATGVNPACTVHPMHHVSLGQCVGDPVFSDASHALSGTSRAAQVVELPRLRLDVHDVDALRASRQRSVLLFRAC